MTLTVTHKFHSGLADSGNATLVQPTNWNDTHDMAATDGTLLGASGSTIVTEIIVGSGLNLAAGVLIATGGSGSPGGSDTYIQYNDSMAFGGDANFTWDKNTSLLTIGTTLKINGSSIVTPDSDAPVALSIITGSGVDIADLTDVAGASLNITSGQGSTSFTADVAGGGGGSVNIHAGSGGNAGGGDADGGTGGTIEIRAGAAGSKAGTGNAHEGGFITMIAGDSVDDGAGGGVVVQTGNSADGDAGDYEIALGQASGAGKNGNFIIDNLPSSDPGKPGAFYQIAGSLFVSL